VGKIVYLMRGLPAAGNSYTATRLAGDGGVVLETDLCFYTQVGDDPSQYDYDEKLLPVARRWNFERFQDVVGRSACPIVVDRGNGLNSQTQRYARHAVDHGYEVELKEPESPWWQELRVLLKYKSHVADVVFDIWAQKLADRTRTDHRMPVKTIRRWMSYWRHDLTVEQILNHRG
jgi:hypothetical protein